jgi:hypothetical protein
MQPPSPRARGGRCDGLALQGVRAVQGDGAAVRPQPGKRGGGGFVRRIAARDLAGHPREALVQPVQALYEVQDALVAAQRRQQQRFAGAALNPHQVPGAQRAGRAHRFPVRRREGAQREGEARPGAVRLAGGAGAERSDAGVQFVGGAQR